ncbi:unnamed protein product, partial [Mesorhabditis spiculigera]
MAATPEDKKKHDLSGPAPEEFLQQIVDSKGKAVMEWYNDFIKEPPSVDAFLDDNNVAKNRHANILLYDHSRVLVEDDFADDDYYHASWLDSYTKKNGYILAQAPFDTQTTQDFWRMVYSHRPCIILVLVDTGGDKDKQKKQSNGTVDERFWPKKDDKMKLCDGRLIVSVPEADQDLETRRYTIQVKEKKAKAADIFKTTLINFRKWPTDSKVPDALLELRAHVLVQQARAEKEALKKKEICGPVMVVCPSGVHRAGTFCALDIVLSRLSEKKLVGLRTTVEMVRRHRYGAVIHYDHYQALGNLVVKSAISSGLISPDQLFDAKNAGGGGGGEAEGGGDDEKKEKE